MQGRRGRREIWFPRQGANRNLVIVWNLPHPVKPGDRTNPSWRHPDPECVLTAKRKTEGSDCMPKWYVLLNKVNILQLFFLKKTTLLNNIGHLQILIKNVAWGKCKTSVFYRCWVNVNIRTHTKSSIVYLHFFGWRHNRYLKNWPPPLFSFFSLAQISWLFSKLINKVSHFLSNSVKHLMVPYC